MSQAIRIVNDKDILNHGRTIIGDGMLPNRIVLRDLGNKFVTHVETLTVSVHAGNEVHLTHSSYECGNYFEHGEMAKRTRTQALDAALADFNRRITER